MELIVKVSSVFMPVTLYVLAFSCAFFSKSFGKGKMMGGFAEKMAFKTPSSRRGAVPIFVWVAISLAILMLATAKSWDLLTSPAVKALSGASGLPYSIAFVAIILTVVFFKTRQENKSGDNKDEKQ